MLSWTRLPWVRRDEQRRADADARAREWQMREHAAAVLRIIATNRRTDEGRET
jgi:hypothetical protein